MNIAVRCVDCTVGGKLNRRSGILASLAVIVLVFLFVAPTLLSNPFNSNYAHLAVLHAYLAPAKQSDRIQTLRLARQIQCRLMVVTSCNEELIQIDESILQAVDQLFFPAYSPIVVIQGTTSVFAGTLNLGGDSRSNKSTQSQQVSDGYVSLFGAGYLQARVFFLGDRVKEWRISVQAQHDAPPPVLLGIWVDDKLVGELSFDKGDQSWGDISLVAQILPGFHMIRIEYINDYFDQQSGQDRNAYIRGIVFTQKDSE